MSFPKQEYVTVLKNPETRIDIGELTGTESCFRRGLSRLRNNTDRRNVIIGLLIVIMLICLMDRLQNDSQAKRNEKVLKEHAKILEYLEIRSQLSLNKDAGTKSRSVRTVTNGIPHFYLEGWRGNYGSTDATDERGIFRWKAPDNTPFDRTDYFYADKTGGRLTKVHITRPGVYFIFAKVTANGRDSVESDTIPPVGIVLMKNDEELEKAWVT